MAAAGGGCQAANLVGGVMQNYEYSKEIEVLAEYDGLEGKRTAVVVQADMGTLYDHPAVASTIARDVAGRLARDVPDIEVLHPSVVQRWQYETPHWDALAYGEIAEELNVERVVYIELYEYRLHPPGNRWEWDGACSATVGVIEREEDGYGSDEFAVSYEVSRRFPDERGIDRESATQQQIERGLLSDFIKHTAWLFHDHIEPKYPDKYRAMDE